MHGDGPGLKEFPFSDEFEALPLSPSLEERRPIWKEASQHREAPPQQNQGLPALETGGPRLYLAAMSLESIIHTDPDILGGTPVFVGTRVPVRGLFDHLEAGDSIDDFLEGFPSVKREQVIAVLEASREQVLQAA